MMCARRIILGGILVMSAVSCMQYPSQKEREFNGSLVDAQTVEDSVLIDAALTGDDVDCYRIISGQDEYASLIDVTLEAKGDVAFDVISTNGTVITTVNDSSSAAGREQLEGIRDLSIDGANCIIRVNRVIPGDIPYRISIVRHSAPENAERELNNDIDGANTLMPMTNTTGFFLPSRRSGHADEADADVYRFGNPTDIMGNFSLSLSGVSGVDAAFILYDADRRTIAEIDSDGTGRGEEIRGFLFPQESVFYVAVFSKNLAHAAAPYHLAFSTARYDETGENEPNNTRVNAKDITDGIPITGYYDYTGDVDLYRMRIAEETANVHLSLSAVNKIDASLAIIDNRGATNVMNVNTIGRGEDIPNAVMQRGVYYIAVQAVNGYHTYRKPYVLKAEAIGRSGGEREPNNDTAHATRLAMPGTVQGYCGERGDIDIYRFDLTTNTTVHVSAVPPGGSDISLSISSAAAQISRGDAHRRGGRENLEADLVPGTYFITISADRVSAAPYRLTLTERRAASDKGGK